MPWNWFGFALGQDSHIENQIRAAYSSLPYIKHKTIAIAKQDIQF